jgi:hypothetical protein
MRERWHRALLAYSDEANGERILVYEYMHSWSLEDKNLWHANWSANMIKHLLLDSGVKQLSECFLCFQTDRNTKERALLNWRRSWHGMADGVKNEGEGSAGNVMHRGRVHFTSQPKIFPLPPITSNLSTHAWSIKCR